MKQQRLSLNSTLMISVPLEEHHIFGDVGRKNGIPNITNLLKIPSKNAIVSQVVHKTANGFDCGCMVKMAVYFFKKHLDIK